MKAGRFVGATFAVFVVRSLLNFGFYGFAIRGRYEALVADHPGLFRDVVPAYAALDLVAALVITYLFVKAGASFGGGIKGGASLGLLLGLLSPVIAGLYWFFSLTFYPVDLLAIELAYQLVAHGVQGALAGAIYKTA